MEILSISKVRKHLLEETVSSFVKISSFPAAIENHFVFTMFRLFFGSIQNLWKIITENSKNGSFATCSYLAYCISKKLILQSPDGLKKSLQRLPLVLLTKLKSTFKQKNVREY